MGGFSIQRSIANVQSLKVWTPFSRISSRSCSWLKINWNLSCDKATPLTFPFFCHFRGILRIRLNIFWQSGFKILPIKLLAFLSHDLNCGKSGIQKGSSSSSRDSSIIALSMANDILIISLIIEILFLRLLNLWTNPKKLEDWTEKVFLKRSGELRVTVDITKAPLTKKDYFSWERNWAQKRETEAYTVI